MISAASLVCFFFFTDPATTEIYTLSLHDALPILQDIVGGVEIAVYTGQIRQFGDGLKHHRARIGNNGVSRSEEHTSELQSRGHLVCRLLLEKKKQQQTKVMLRSPKRSWHDCAARG